MVKGTTRKLRRRTRRTMFYGGAGSEDECSICLEVLPDEAVKGSNIMKLPVCGHRFHITCIHDWIEHNKETCPLCRKPFDCYVEKPNGENTEFTYKGVEDGKPVDTTIYCITPVRMKDTKITDTNLKILVNKYFTDKERLPLFLKDIPMNKWDVSNVTSMETLFFSLPNTERESFNENINDWDVSNVTDMRSMFSRCKSFNQPLDKWHDKLTQVKFMNRMFFRCENFNQPLNDWKLSDARVMGEMFSGCTEFNQPLDKWHDKLKKVINIEEMFSGCKKFDQDIHSWKLPKLSYKNNVFKDCPIRKEFRPKLYILERIFASVRNRIAAVRNYTRRTRTRSSFNQNNPMANVRE